MKRITIYSDSSSLVNPDPGGLGTILEFNGHTNQHKITATLVKGHVGHIQNERCDILAQNEAERLKGL